MTVDEAIAMASETGKKCECLDCAAFRVLIKEVYDLRERVRIADSVRDDARRVSQQYLDEKRELQAQLAKVNNG
jgi:hypothetical protein